MLIRKERTETKNSRYALPNIMGVGEDDKANLNKGEIK